MHTLREMLNDRSRFFLGVELVTTRGTIADKQALLAREFPTQLVHSSEVDWVSITDNAGGNPQLSPMALGKPILYAGKEVLIHLSCKAFNRNGLESEAWELCSEGFHNILAPGGDYDRLKYEGRQQQLLKHAPVIQGESLRGTSSWSNAILERDHTARAAKSNTKAPLLQ